MVSERRLSLMEYRQGPEKSPVERACVSLTGALAAVSAFSTF